MPDTKRGREAQARNADRRQRERDVEEALARLDEEEPDLELEETAQARREAYEEEEIPRECHRRECDELARFFVVERYQEETGQGAVEAAAALCRDHTAEESPTNLDGSYADYVFKVTPI